MSQPWDTPLPGMPEKETARTVGRPLSSGHKGAEPQGTVDHPAHYGGADSVYEAIKVIEAWELGFNLGNCVKYVARAGKKGPALVDLQKAAWYLNREIEQRSVGT